MKLIHERMMEDDYCEQVTCTECGASVPVAVVMRAEPEQEGALAFLCLACVDMAMQLLNAQIAQFAVEFNANTIAAYDLLDDEQKKTLAVNFIEHLKEST